jgi:hypothetical protein
MKKVYLLLLTCSFIINGYSQPSVIKNKLSQIFYGVDFPLTRFDIREKFNGSNNLYEYKEIEPSNYDYDNVEVKLKNNPILGFTQKSTNKYLDISFKKGYDRSDLINMSLWYKIEDVNFSRNQLNEVIKIFKPISYKIVKQDVFKENNKSIKIGEDYFIFSTQSNYNRNNHCIRLSYVYFKENHIVNQNSTYELSNGEYYWLTIVVLSNNIK